MPPSSQGRSRLSQRFRNNRLRFRIVRSRKRRYFGVCSFVASCRMHRGVAVIRRRCRIHPAGRLASGYSSAVSRSTACAARRSPKSPTNVNVQATINSTTAAPN